MNDNTNPWPWLRSKFRVLFIPKPGASSSPKVIKEYSFRPTPIAHISPWHKKPSFSVIHRAEDNQRNSRVLRTWTFIENDESTPEPWPLRKTTTTSTQTAPIKIVELVEVQRPRCLNQDVDAELSQHGMIPEVVIDKQTKLVERVQALESECKLSEIRYEKLLVSYQEHVVKDLGPGLWSPPDNEAVKATFNKLAKKMKQWAKGFVTDTTSLDTTLSSNDYLTLVESPRNVVDLEIDTLNPPLGQGKGPAMLLNALLTHAIHAAVFQNPFFFMGPMGDALYVMYQRFLRCE
jgi:hypothetical protein